VKNVREAWRQVARDSGANMGAMRMIESASPGTIEGDNASPAPAKPMNWTV